MAFPRARARESAAPFQKKYGPKRQSFAAGGGREKRAAWDEARHNGTTGHGREHGERRSGSASDPVLAEVLVGLTCPQEACPAQTCGRPPTFPGSCAHGRLRLPGAKEQAYIRCLTPTAKLPRHLVHTHTAMGRAPPARSVGQGVADAFNLLVCAGTPVAVAGGASALVALPAFLLSALRGSMDGWVQL